MAITLDAKHPSLPALPQSDYIDPVSAARRPAQPRRAARWALQVVLTARDGRVLQTLYRFGCVSLPLLARLHFGGSEPAARERLRKLERAQGGGYVRLLPTVQGECGAYRLTDKGLSGVAPGKRAPRRRQDTGARPLFHAMLVAEVAAWHLARRVRDGGSVRWYTEQDIRDGLEWLPLPHRRGRFRLPDGVFEVATASGELHRVAVEVERRAKRPQEYPEKLAWYRQKLAAGVFAHVRWFVADAETERVLTRQVTAADLDDGRMTVTPLPEGVRLYGHGAAPAGGSGCVAG
jgi:hypothetical protein